MDMLKQKDLGASAIAVSKQLPTHATEYGQLLSIEQANILDRYLDKLPNYVLPQFKRRFEAMARELTDLGYREAEARNA